MINKKSLWFLTLFSLILVLSVYYITMPSELLMTGNNPLNTKTETCSGDECKKKEEPTVKVQESEILTALRVEWDEQVSKQMDEFKNVLTNSKSTVDEKNNAYDKIKELNTKRGEEENIEKKILEEYKLKAFVKIDNLQIRVVVYKDKLTNEEANNIMRTIQGLYDKKMDISVKFQK